MIRFACEAASDALFAVAAVCSLFAGLFAWFGERPSAVGCTVVALVAAAGCAAVKPGPVARRGEGGAP